MKVFSTQQNNISSGFPQKKTCRCYQINFTGMKQVPNQRYILTCVWTSLLQLPTRLPNPSAKNKYVIQHQVQGLVAC